MTSKLVVNTIEADTGISSVSFASSISMNSTSKFHFSAAGVDIGADTNINRPAAGVLGFNINSSEKVRITSAGKVGIGTDNPSGMLDISGANTTDMLMFKNGATNFAKLGYNSASGTAILDVRSEGHTRFLTNGNNERLRITSGGDILLNKGNNQNTLMSNTSDGSDNQSIFVGGGGGPSDTRGAYIWAKGNEYTTTGGFLQLNAGNVGTAPITFSTGGNERLRIDSNGNMGLGTLLASNAGSAGAGLKIEKYVQRNNIYAFPDGYYGASLGEVQNTENKVWASIDSHYNRTSAVSAGIFLSAFHADAGGSGCGAAIKNLKAGNALTFSTVTTGASVGSVAVEAERLRIHSTGQVTKPASCAFNVTPNGNQYLGSGETLTSWKTTDSRGFENTTTGGYFGSGIFTAPVTGAYYFTSNILLYDTNGTNSIHLYWQKNGSGTHTYWNTRFNGGDFGYGNYMPVAGACTMYMSAGDTCRIRISFSGSQCGMYGQDQNWGNWGGFLIG